MGELTENPIWNIPWGHHRCIIDKCLSQTEKAMFFVRKTIENEWSRNMLLNFLDTDLYERQGKATETNHLLLDFALNRTDQKNWKNIFSCSKNIKKGIWNGIPIYSFLIIRIRTN